MNAGAYGSDWKAILVRALVVDAGGQRWLANDELDLAYRHSALVPGQVVAQVEFRLTPRAARRDQGDRRRAPGEAEGDAADQQAHVRQRLQEPGPRARRGADDRGVRPEGPPDRRRADLAAPRRTSSRTPATRPRADAIALMAEARRRAHEQFGVMLEREVELLGDLELPPLCSAGPRGRAANPSGAHGRRPRPRPPPCDLPAAARRRRRARPRRRRRRRSTSPRARRRSSRSTGSRSRARRRQSPRRIRTALDAVRRAQPRPLRRRGRARRRLATVVRDRRCAASTATSRTR